MALSLLSLTFKAKQDVHNDPGSLTQVIFSNGRHFIAK